MGRFSVTYVLLVPLVAWKHRLVQAPGPGVTVVFLTFVVLAQGGGGTDYCCEQGHKDHSHLPCPANCCSWCWMLHLFDECNAAAF